MMTELLPCPFCGAQPTVFNHGLSTLVHCEACGATGKWTHGSGDYPQRAIAAWNRRVPAQGVPVEAIRMMIERFGGGDPLLPWSDKGKAMVESIRAWLDTQPQPGHEGEEQMSELSTPTERETEIEAMLSAMVHRVRFAWHYEMGKVGYECPYCHILEREQHEMRHSENHEAWCAWAASARWLDAQPQPGQEVDNE